MKKQIFITQKPKVHSNGIADYSWCDTIFMKVTTDDGEVELFERSIIGTWEKVTYEVEIEYFKNSEPIELGKFLREKYPGFSLQSFKRTSNLALTRSQNSFDFEQHLDNKESQRAPDFDAGFTDKPAVVLATLPNGAMLCLSSFIFENICFSTLHEHPTLPIKIISSRYTADGKYELKNLEIPFSSANSLSLSLEREANAACGPFKENKTK